MARAELGGLERGRHGVPRVTPRPLTGTFPWRERESGWGRGPTVWPSHCDHEAKPVVLPTASGHPRCEVLVYISARFPPGGPSVSSSLSEFFPCSGQSSVSGCLDVFSEPVVCLFPLLCPRYSPSYPVFLYGQCCLCPDKKSVRFQGHEAPLGFPLEDGCFTSHVYFCSPWESGILSAV